MNKEERQKKLDQLINCYYNNNNSHKGMTISGIEAWGRVLDKAIELIKSDPLEEYHKEDRLFELYKQNLTQEDVLDDSMALGRAIKQLDYFNTNK